MKNDFHFKALDLVNIKSSYKRSARLILIALFTIIILIFILPWQQTIVGHGKVTMFSPMDRPQRIFTQIDAKISKWHVVEGQYVKKGDVLLDLEEVNPMFLDLNQEQRLNNKKLALIKKQKAIQESINALSMQIKSLQVLPDNIEESQSLTIKQRNDNLIAAKQAFITAQFNLDRIKNLFKDGLRSKRDLELAELAITNKQTELDIAKRDYEIAKLNREQLLNETIANIESIKSDKANAEEKYASVEAQIIKLDIDISNIEKRKSQRTLVSPINGQVTRLHTLGRLETVKAGQSLAVIVPDVVDQAVELLVSDYNAPLMKPGRHVRIMFSGWPAVQFIGWPMLSVGTFGGKIAAVDAVDNGRNQYRIIVRPDYDRISKNLDEPWPTYPLLRPGTQAHGWILADVVSIAFEIWRQFNGFPPSIPVEQAIAQENNYYRKKQ